MSRAARVVVDRVASLREEEESKVHGPERGTGRSWRGAPPVTGIKQRAAQALRHTFVRLLPEPAALREIIERRNTTTFSSFNEPLVLMKKHLPIQPVAAKVPVWLKGSALFIRRGRERFFSVTNSDVWMIIKTNDGSLVFSTMDHEKCSEMLNKSVELFAETYTFTASADEERAALSHMGTFEATGWLVLGFKKGQDVSRS
ncbi:hypothetical protein SPRG_14890 [Saprolegnia parasitica CBS 223.65]|uniref:Uncharacterized protein n=1 Tax=Saprolegnia parasitica (strain CBS 223.65) TaxID=695850 RepID=A0A067BSQ6_SAPPC|nr:hypothetical protein SPRG_14890 [Saprolegnia parasitica CBS 223.65]KDO19860.1 hypothetical protein SPRG_14890 [Saprolegnia parasitica CBS 223.65]|eukprot:XP_012209418.1 hypothetical protein SPRG_14890 [Saprolegnia parasitica CBS 223.65]